MSRTAINFRDKLGQFSGRWEPRVVAEMNDYQFKLVKVKGEFVWHSHAQTDEVFLVLEGTLKIAFRDGGDVEIGPGEMFVVPKNEEHRPYAEEECHVLLIEPKGVVNTGDAGGDRTARNDVWV